MVYLPYFLINHKDSTKFVDLLIVNKYNIPDSACSLYKHGCQDGGPHFPRFSCYFQNFLKLYFILLTHSIQIGIGLCAVY